MGAVIGIALCWGITELSTFQNKESEVWTTAVGLERGPDNLAPSSARDSLKAILEIRSPTEQRKTLHGQLSGLDNAQVANLIQESTEIDDNQKLFSIQEVMFERLAQSDPNSALKLMWQMETYRWRDLIPIVFGTWSRVDVHAALSMANTLDAPFRNEATNAALAERIELSNSELVEIAQSHKIESIAHRIINEKQVMRLIDEPEQALQLVANTNLGEDQQKNLVMKLFDPLIQRDGIDQVLPLLSVLHTTFGETTELLSDLVQEIAKHDPVKTWQYVMGLPQILQD